MSTEHSRVRLQPSADKREGRAIAAAMQVAPGVEQIVSEGFVLPVG